MWFRHLHIHHLRNLESLTLTLCPGLNYFHGPNGAGKTAILEAVHLLARGRSFRSHQAGDVITQGASALIVRAQVVDEHQGERSLALSRGRTGRAEFKIDGESGGKLSQVAEMLPLQVMVPSLSDLVFGAPAERRQWLDWGVFHVEHDYLTLHRRYLHALRQRNAALKAVAAGELNREDLAVWTEEMARSGERVAESRDAYLARLTPVLAEVMGDLAPHLKVEVLHRKGWPSDQPLLKVLGDSVSREVKSGTSQSGPHRGDVELRVAGLVASTSLSRGQGKSLACGLMLAQARLLRQTARRSSVFLIDDIGAELDLEHNERFFGSLVALGAQILATSNTGPGNLLKIPEVETSVFHVEHGDIRSS